MVPACSSSDKQNGLAQAKPRQAADLQTKQCSATKAAIDMPAKTKNWACRMRGESSHFVPTGSRLERYGTPAKALNHLSLNELRSCSFGD
jgi:hypothetical protein